MTEFTFDELTVSCLHKDAYNYRPSAYFWSKWNSMTPAQKQEEWDYMCRLVEENEEREANLNKLRRAEWEEHIAKMMSDYGIDRVTAIRWDVDANTLGDGDIGMYCWYTMASFEMEDEIRKALA